MKRIGNIWHKVISIENLTSAAQKARKGKKNRYEVKQFDKNPEENLVLLHRMLYDKTFTTSAYRTFKIYEPKEREVYALPYFPDQIVHYAAMNYLQPILSSTFTADTYACIPGRGIGKAFRNLKKALSNRENTPYCLKLDIRKFYPTIDHTILKGQIRRKVKDKDFLWLIDDIIDSVPKGIPIGNFISQYFSNFNLTGFDHWLKEEIKIAHYFRYADDIVILHHSREYLHQLRVEISYYLEENLRLQLKPNYQVFPVAARGIDFVGYVFFHTHILMRKTIKKNFARAVHKRKPRQSIAAYYGWAKHCNSKNLLRKLLGHEEFQRFQY